MDTDATFRFLSGFGRPILLRRLTAKGLYLEVVCMARVSKFTPQLHYQIEQAGGYGQGEREVIISNKEIERKQWPGPPMRGDLVVIPEEGWSGIVQGCASNSLPGGIVVRYDINLRGTG
jgi:hypothetical protein